MGASRSDPAPPASTGDGSALREPALPEGFHPTDWTIVQALRSPLARYGALPPGSVADHVAACAACQRRTDVLRQFESRHPGSIATDPPPRDPRRRRRILALAGLALLAWIVRRLLSAP